MAGWAGDSGAMEPILRWVTQAQTRWIAPALDQIQCPYEKCCCREVHVDSIKKEKMDQRRIRREIGPRTRNS